jgi:hypothetical protein
MAKKALAEDEANSLLCRCVAELKEVNTWLEQSNVEMGLTVSRSGDAVTVLHCELDAEIENYELLRLVNTCFLNERNEAWSWVTDLDMKLVEMETSTTKDTAALEAKLVEMEARAVESSVAAKRCFEYFCTKLVGELAPLCEAYERNIWSLGGICSPVPGTAPSTEDYIQWLKSEVDFLPQVFTDVNKNFVFVAIKGVLAMVGGGSPIDLEALRRVAASCGADILWGTGDVKKVTRTITREWWCLFGCKAALSITEAELRQVKCYMCYF